MKKFMRTLAALSLALLCTVAFTACGDDDDDNGGNGGGGGTNTNGVSTNLPTSLSGKTFNMTTTAQQNNSEPVGSTFQVAFNDDSGFTYTPSPENTDATGPVSGSYTYDPTTGTVVLTRDGKDTQTGQLNFSSPTAGNVHFVESDGDFLDADFTINP